MLAMELGKNEVKDFMAKLLKENIFDEFDLRSAEIAATTRITIDGTLETGFSPWESTRPLVFEIIKLNAKPRFMKIIFSHKSASELHANAAALFLNIIYENGGINFTTATAQRQFSLEKETDILWDDWMREFFIKNKISATDRA